MRVIMLLVAVAAAVVVLHVCGGGLLLSGFRCCFFAGGGALLSPRLTTLRLIPPSLFPGAERAGVGWVGFIHREVAWQSWLGIEGMLSYVRYVYYHCES